MTDLGDRRPPAEQVCTVGKAVEIVSRWPVSDQAKQALTRDHWQAVCQVDYWLSVWSSQESTDRWMSAPNAYFGGRSGYECVDESPAVIERIAGILLGAAACGYT